MREIPPDLPFNEWVRDLVAQHMALAPHWEPWTAEQDAKDEEAYNDREVTGRNLQGGEVVLRRQGQVERQAGGGVLPPYLTNN